MKTTIPIFFGADDARSPFVATAISSIKENASKDLTYHIHILTDGISERNRRKISRLAGEGFRIEFYPLTERLSALEGVRELGPEVVTSLPAYFRFFIPELFPQWDKAICLDTDLVVPGDISRLYCECMGSKLLGAVVDGSIQRVGPFVRYIEEYVGVAPHNYVNVGVLLLNCKRPREVDLSGRFLEWMDRYGLDAVAPEQDYLNALCRYGIHYLDPDWNAMPSECTQDMDEPQIIHFSLSSRPWLSETVPYDEVFWKYVALSGYGHEIRALRRTFLQDPEARGEYREGITRLIRKAGRLTGSEVSFRSLTESHQALRLCS